MARKTTIGKEPNDEIYTPQWLIGWLGVDIDLDPCWSELSNVRPRYYFDKDTNGLAHSWAIDGVVYVFVNNPYSDNVGWIKKVVTEAVDGRVVIMLTPAKPCENTWCNFAWPHVVEVGFLRGRIKHDLPLDAPSQSGTFGSALLFFGDKDKIASLVNNVRTASRGHKHEPTWVRKVA